MEELGLDFLDVLKLALAVVIGGAVGAEREMRDKAAGFRTNIMICLGATIFTMMSMKLATGMDDATRIASNIVTGIGFLGAGVILREGGRVIGLTTASTIWVVAALGMAIGAAHFMLAAVGATFVLVVLWFMPQVEVLLGSTRERRLYRIECATGDENYNRLRERFETIGFRIRSHQRMKTPQRMVYEWEAIGRSSAHQEIMRLLTDDDAVTAFEVRV